MTTTQQRKREFIDPAVQGAIARRMALHWALFVLIAAVLVVGMKWICDPLTPLATHLSAAWWTYGPIFIVLACLAPMFVYDAVKLSNRFTGPVLRFRRAARALAAGERPEKIKLRRGDFWTDLAGDINVVIDRYAPEGDERR